MEEYLEEYGHTFNKRLFDFAVTLLMKRNGKPVDAFDKEAVEQFLKTAETKLKVDNSHDVPYVFNLMLSEQDNVSQDVAKAAADTERYINNQYGWNTRAFDEFYIKTVALGIPIYWDEMI